MPDLLECAQIFWGRNQQGWSTEKMLQELCGQLDFPRSELRVRQILKVSNVIPEFQQLLLKGVHSLDYLALLANHPQTEQGVFHQKWVQPYHLNYNTQKKLFEWLHDWADRDFEGSISKAIAALGSCKNAEELTEKLFSLRFPSV